MATRKTKTDKRLLGTWKSDKRRTFKDFVPPPEVRGKKLEEKLESLKAILGKLNLRYTRRKVHAECEGSRESVDYEVLGSDAQSVAIRWSGQLPEDQAIEHIHFEGSYYWISRGRMRVFFRRID